MVISWLFTLAKSNWHLFAADPPHNWDTLAPASCSASLVYLPILTTPGLVYAVESVESAIACVIDVFCLWLMVWAAVQDIDYPQDQHQLGR